MKVYTYSEARQHLSKVLEIARKEEVIIKRRGGETFSLVLKKMACWANSSKEILKRIKQLTLLIDKNVTLSIKIGAI